MQLTRKRLELLSAMLDARMVASAEQQAMLQVYNHAVALLSDWEKGVPLEEQGVTILEACLDKLDQVDRMAAAYGKPVYEQLAASEVHPTNSAPPVMG